MKLRRKIPAPVRFWPKVDKSPGHGPRGECWLWRGAIAGEYGRFLGHTRVVQAHRFAYEEKFGSIPNDLFLDHYECDNKLCVNPDHLRPATVLENTRRHFARMTHCKRGHLYTEETTRTTTGRRACKICIAMNGVANKLGLTTKEFMGE